MTEVLARRDRALTPEETEALLRDRLGDEVLRSTLEYEIFTLWISQEGWFEAARLCRDEPLLDYDLFDSLFGVDAREEGFDVVAILYSTSTGNRLVLRTRCDGGREQPVCPSITDVYRGADWMERETWDMFGIDFPGHRAISPRILTVENFDGWPLRKDFHLASRAAKPWPGVKEPAELDEDGNVIERAPKLGDAPGPYELDKAMGEQAKLANPLPEPDTLEGEQVDDAADDADVAPDSEHVLAGDAEQELEDDQKLTNEADVEVAGDTADEAADALAERAETGEAGGAEAPAADARKRADDRRKQQAEARARKAAERAEGSGATPAAERTDDEDLPSDADSGAKDGTAGPASGTPAEDTPADPAEQERKETGDVGSQASHEVVVDPEATAADDPREADDPDDAGEPDEGRAGS